MIEYGDEDLLMLSGIQHITFCERQWALIHIEQQRVENNLTVEGNWLHSKVDNPHAMTKRNETVTLRSVPLTSKRLGLYGISDAVEMTHTCGNNSIIHPEYEGKWHPDWRYMVEHIVALPTSAWIGIAITQSLLTESAISQLHHKGIEKKPINAYSSINYFFKITISQTTPPG